MNGGLDPNAGVDVSRNFNVRNCFSSRPIMNIMEGYIFNMIIPNMNKFFELRLRMNDRHTTLVRNSMRLIAEASKYVGRNASYTRNINTIYKTFWKIPQLKELTESLKSQTIQFLPERQSGILADDVPAGGA
jgi:hypothetical protein